MRVRVWGARVVRTELEGQREARERRWRARVYVRVYVCTVCIDKTCTPNKTNIAKVQIRTTAVRWPQRCHVPRSATTLALQVSQWYLLSPSIVSTVPYSSCSDASKSVEPATLSIKSLNTSSRSDL